jgi:hypothetical protein
MTVLVDCSQVLENIYFIPSFFLGFRSRSSVVKFVVGPEGRSRVRIGRFSSTPAHVFFVYVYEGVVSLACTILNHGTLWHGACIYIRLQCTS